MIDVGAEDLGAGARAEELRELVWSAADALNPGEREVLELTVRHGLDGAELAGALGVSVNSAHALSSRARAQLERSLGALLVARTGRDACAELGGLLEGWDGRLTPLLRKRLARHVEKCAVCGETKKHRLNPVALLAGVPFLLAPPSLREDVLRDVSYQRRLSDRAGAWGPDGFPRPVAGPRRRRVAWYAAAVAVLTGLLTVGLLVRPGAEPAPVAEGSLAQALDGERRAPLPIASTAVPPPTTTSPPPIPATPTRSRSAQPTLSTRPAAPTPTVSSPPVPVPSTPPTRTPKPPPPPPPPPVTITLSSTVLTPDCTLTYRARLTAVVSGATATSVLATWTDPAGLPGSAAMSPVGDGSWTALVSLTGGLDHAWKATASLAPEPIAGTATLRHDCVVIG